MDHSLRIFVGHMVGDSATFKKHDVLKKLKGLVKEALGLIEGKGCLGRDKINWKSIFSTRKVPSS